MGFSSAEGKATVGKRLFQKPQRSPKVSFGDGVFRRRFLAPDLAT
ncbi:hypothetical protein [Almyronema epifaneia]|uniref:Uncharacterized protein n=1 Tax=Almyronema epifaneia S1 TaxID=2991925 RepID=A0ABW6IB47_9CYAN